MFRIRFHGRGGDGMKTASRILGSSFFLEGYHVQDAPRYGAERRGAPVFAYVRADNKVIYERGEIHKPDLIVIADDTLLLITPQTILEGMHEKTIILIISDLNQDDLQDAIKGVKRIISISPADLPANYRIYLSSITAAASAGLTGKIKLSSILQSIKDELSPVQDNLLQDNISIAEKIYGEMKLFSGIVSESDDEFSFKDPEFIVLPLQNASIATPSIRTGATTIKNLTGSWRTYRPVIDYSRCSRCMLCNIYCPDSAILQNENGFPEIDYNYCKGCLICGEVCPSDAIKKEDEKKIKSKAT